MDVVRGVGRAQGCVPLVRQRLVQLCLLRDRAERPHCGGSRSRSPSRRAIMSWAWLGPGGVFCWMVSLEAAQSALCSRVSLWWELAQANQNACSVCCPRTCRLS